MAIAVTAVALPVLAHTTMSCQRLPAELLSKIFDELTLAELVTASHVAATWREIAHRHRKFWYDITLDAPGSTGALDLFASRLASGGDKPIALSIQQPENSDPITKFFMRQRVLPALKLHMNRVERLELVVNVALARQVWNALKDPAARLYRFTLRFFWPLNDRRQRPPPVVPDDVFARNAPRLRTFNNASAVLHRPFPSAMRGLETLVFNMRYTVFPIELADVFAHCSSLKQLFIAGNSCTIVDRPHVSPLPALQVLYVNLPPGATTIAVLEAPSIRAAHIPRISCSLGEENARLMISHVEDPKGNAPLTLEMYKTTPSHPEFILRYTAPSKSLTRVLFGPPELPTQAIPDVCFAPHLVARLTELGLSTCALDLAACALPPLPRCTRLTVLLDPDSEHPRLPTVCERRLVLPALKKLHINAHAPDMIWLYAFEPPASPVNILADNVCAFVAALLENVSTPLQLEFGNIVLDSALDVIVL